jgi:hypothetical protein
MNIGARGLKLNLRSVFILTNVEILRFLLNIKI